MQPVSWCVRIDRSMIKLLSSSPSISPPVYQRNLRLFRMSKSFGLCRAFSALLILAVCFTWREHRLRESPRNLSSPLIKITFYWFFGFPICSDGLNESQNYQQPKLNLIDIRSSEETFIRWEAVRSLSELWFSTLPRDTPGGSSSIVWPHLKTQTKQPYPQYFWLE